MSSASSSFLHDILQLFTAFLFCLTLSSFFGLSHSNPTRPAADTAVNREPSRECASRLGVESEVVRKLLGTRPGGPGSGYSQISPEAQILLEVDVTHGAVISTESDCSPPPQSSRGTTGLPTRDRALCPFHHRLNYNPLRVPPVITEAACSCPMPASASSPSLQSLVRCEPLYYDMRVLLFDENCEEYEERLEKISLACVAVVVSEQRSSRQPILLEAEAVAAPL